MNFPNQNEKIVIYHTSPYQTMFGVHSQIKSGLFVKKKEIAPKEV